MALQQCSRAVLKLLMAAAGAKTNPPVCQKMVYNAAFTRFEI